ASIAVVSNSYHHSLMTATAEPVLILDGSPAGRRETVRDLLDHRKILMAMARTDFQVNYKRAVLGLVWAVAIPLIQAAVLAIVFGPRLMLLFPAIALLVAFTAALSATLAVCHVYFRDIRHLVQAAILLWFYATPIFYPATQLPAWIRAFLDFNPMSGVVIL